MQEPECLFSGGMEGDGVAGDANFYGHQDIHSHTREYKFILTPDISGSYVSPPNLFLCFVLKAKNSHTPEDRQKIAQFMCHDTATADRFYALHLDAMQAVEHRKLFEAALCGPESVPEVSSKKEPQIKPGSKSQAKQSKIAKSKQVSRQ